MRNTRKALLAAGLIAGAAALTGCTANTTTAPTPQAAQQATAEPATAQPSPAATMEATAEPAEEETPAPLALLVDGKEVAVDAAEEQGSLLLPLEATAEALGWKADSQETEEETQVRRVVTLDKEDSRITVSWTVSDNTTKGITWQKDGLLIPVDTRITTMNDVVYVPAAFFEEAMDVTVTRTQKGVSVDARKPEQTPPTQEDSSGENG
ncbi:MAG: stalk domain-containing protein [Candidatus Ventricola sp.]